MHCYKVAAVGLLCAVCVEARAWDGQDSVRRISDVVVVARMAFRHTMPRQTLSGGELKRLGSHSVADAVRLFSGLQLKDYGGIGGLKTVNMRSMGSQHMGVCYDGVQMGNAQNGQVDLGQLSLENVGELTVYNGQKSSVLQTAADYGNAGSLYISTRRPVFRPGRDWNLRMKARGGGGGLAGLSAMYERRLGGGFSIGWNTEAFAANGRYRFRYKRKAADGSTAYDTTAVRQNGDVQAVRSEANLYGTMLQGSLSAKAYAYVSSRGVPGAIVGNVWKRGERQADGNFFAQAAWQRGFGRRLSVRLLAKCAMYRNTYSNRDTTRMLFTNKYVQREAYASAAAAYELLPWWSLSASYDFRANSLDSDMGAFAYPRRKSHAAAAATAVDFPRFKAQASIYAVVVADRTRTHGKAPAATAATPALFVSCKPFRTDAVTIRAFAKQSYRTPTFNELYYTEIGNANLKPERATQVDIGADASIAFPQGMVKRMEVKADAYYNVVNDKIVAYPKGQQFRWTMLNLGRVEIAGADLSAKAEAEPAKGLTAWAMVQYTYQRAVDTTDPGASYYRHQVPYTPLHSATVSAAAEWRGWAVAYCFTYAGERYSQQENTPYNHMQPWYTSDISLQKDFLLGGVRCRAHLAVNNLLGQSYDVVKNYPMPGRNCSLSMEISL